MLLGESPLAIALDEFCPLVEQFPGRALEKCVLLTLQPNTGAQAF